MPYKRSIRDERAIKKSDAPVKQLQFRLKSWKRKPMTVIEMCDLRRKQKREQQQRLDEINGHITLPRKSNIERAKEIITAKKSGEIICERVIEKDNTTWYRFNNAILTNDQWNQLKQDMDLTTLEGDERWTPNSKIYDVILF